MKIKIFILLIGSFLLYEKICISQPPFPDSRASIKFPKEKAILNVKGSIIIGEYFVGVKGHFFANHIPYNPINAKVYIEGYEDSDTVKLSDLKQNFKLLSTDPKYPVFDGDIGLLKVGNASRSANYHINITGMTTILQVEILEEGDIISFVGMRSYDGKQAYNFPARWYKVVN